jgi:hypothetical protein
LPDWPGFHMRARIAGCSPGCGLMDCQNKRENSRNRLLIGCPERAAAGNLGRDLAFGSFESLYAETRLSPRA